MGIAAAIGVLSPFPFYYWLRSYPQICVELCGKGRDPCKVMANVAHFLKLIQFLSLFSVSTFSWPPPCYFCPLIAFGQFLNFRVYQLLSESGTYYGARFGKNIPWVTEFPFGYIKDPQYVGSILSVSAGSILSVVTISVHFVVDVGICCNDICGVKERSCNSCKTTLIIQHLN